MARQIPYTEAELAALGLQAETLPRHVAIIMDGNGRWAGQRGLPRVEGHRRGSATVRSIVEECGRLNLQQLTLYCFSVDNWKRPQAELEFLMLLLQQYLVQEREEILEQNVRFTSIGRRDRLPLDVLRELDENIRLSRNNTGLTLCLAINYGGRTEIADAARSLAEKAFRGELDPVSINEETFAQALYTAGMPDPDLLIRTAGEMRISNYLLWQISYAELWVTDACWPDFTREHLHAALRDFASRDRTFGGLNE